ncbi:hypothetical protein EDD11_007512 [Mortierella claussenii]|nr:hypothetical protein EDD11_007512 [Mortierella claussenii]
MGGIISRLRQSNDSDYEKILSDLDSNIRKAEMRLSAINVREKRLLSHWTVYTILAWMGYTAAFALYLHPQYLNDPQLWALALAPVVLGLPVIYLGRSLITVWYKRAKTNEESQLSLLRADQRHKVEELKKKTAYYSTKTLLERYDPSSQRPGGQKPSGPDGRPLPTHQNGQLRPQQPNMMDPGLRQRQGLGVTNAQGIPTGQGRPTGHSSGMQQQSHMGHSPESRPRGPQGFQGPQQHQFDSGQPHPNGGRPSHHGSNMERHWYDKIVDVIVGDEGPDTKYALICGQCLAHNGLALPQEIDDIQYVCPKCNYFNPSRRNTRLAASGVCSTPEMTLLQARSQPLPASRDPSPSPSAQRRPLTPDHPQHHTHHHAHVDHGGVEVHSHGYERVPDVHVSDHSEADDIEFVNNWNDSDAEGVNHDEGHEEENGREGESEEAQGYVVNKDDSPEIDLPPKVKTKKAGSGSKSKVAGARKTKRA